MDDKTFKVLMKELDEVLFDKKISDEEAPNAKTNVSKNKSSDLYKLDA